MKKNNILLLCFILILMSSCASKQKKEIYKVSGYVMDENRNPLYQYGIEIKDKNGRTFYSETDRNGMFVFKNLQVDDYEISGEKETYGKISSRKEFLDELTILCFQVNTAQSIIDNAERDIEKARYEDALEKLETICFESGSVLSEYISFCKALIEEVKSEKS